MNPNIAANQQRLFLEFLAELRPHLRRDSGLPGRIKAIFARNRALGSTDRKLYRELIYTAVRFLPWVDALLDKDPPTAAKVIAWLAPDLKPTTKYRAALCADWPPVPNTLAEKSKILSTQLGGARPPDALSSTRPEDGFHLLDPQSLLPGWFQEHCPVAFTEPHLTAINSRASIWVRLQNHDRNLVLDEFRAKGWAIEQTADFPDALCLPPNAEVAGTDAYRRGFVEIQDLGSQMVLAHAPIASGERWLDACAGAGGKTLQLARLVPAGHVDATDIRPEILEELRDRAKRARLDNIAIVRDLNHSRSVIARSPADDEAIQLDRRGALRAPGDDKTVSYVGQSYDGVLVDAPCSGSGTWRRQPHLKWCISPEAIATFAKMQLEILATNAPLLKPGGLLVYATCSLSHYENQDVAAAFLKAHPHFKAETPAKNYGGNFDGLGTTLLPGTRNTDGFYVALLRRVS